MRGPGGSAAANGERHAARKHAAKTEVRLGSRSLAAGAEGRGGIGATRGGFDVIGRLDGGTKAVGAVRGSGAGRPPADHGKAAAARRARA